ncbi:MAG TPA: peptidylprolyl isomerase [Gemmataceae bacterium]|jgi:parvulin-like peptidyl-prolyl isomerase
MSARKKTAPARRVGWRSLAVLTGGLAVVAGAGYWVRSALLPRADAQAPVAARQTGAPTAAPTAAPTTAPAAREGPTDYSRRVVAHLYDNEAITREQLGEHLIDRHGDKLDLLINKRIIDDACRQYNVEVTAAEVDGSLAEELQGLAIDQKTFVNTLLARYHKNLYEWKEDVIRSRLQLAKLCRSRVKVSDDELRKAFEAAYGEKIECQLILWPKDKDGRGKADALADYARLRDDAEAFDQKAKAQPKAELAATAGHVRPFGRYVMGDENFDRIVFRLKPNEVSEVFETIDGHVLVKCRRHYPADTSVHFESVRGKLEKEMADKKVVKEMQTAFDTLKKKADPKIILHKKDKAEDSDKVPDNGGPRARQAVAFYNGQTPITREDFGEFLIARYGVEQLELLVNRRIIDKECQAHGIRVTPQEIEEALNADLKKLGAIDLKVFQKDFLGPYNKNLYEWREDVIRPRLLMTKLCRDRVKAEETDIKMAYDAEYGEKLEGQMILWPADQTKYAMMEYTQVRDDPKAFDEKAKHQASGTLAAKGGKIGPFGRHTLGNETVEQEAFKLREGEVTTLIGTPEGNVVFKLTKRIPANTAVALDSVRDKLTKEVFERKVQIEMQTAFRDLRAKANPRVLLKDSSKPAELVESTKKLLPGADKKDEAEKPAAQH